MEHIANEAEAADKVQSVRAEQAGKQRKSHRLLEPTAHICALCQQRSSHFIAPECNYFIQEWRHGHIGHNAVFVCVY